MNKVVSDGQKRRFHTMGLHEPIVRLNTALPTRFVLTDGICGDLDFEEGGNPVPTGMAFACADPVLNDAYAASLMGYRPDEVEHLALAAQYGVGCADLSAANLRFLNQPAAARPAAPPRKAARLARYVDERSACSACYSALIRGLSRLSAGELSGLPSPVAIGQGWRGHAGDVGVGACTSSCRRTLAGCPPAASDVAAFLRDCGR